MTLQQLSASAPPRSRGAAALAALSALLFFLSLISIGLPPGGSALPLLGAAPGGPGTETLTLTLVGEDSSSSNSSGGWEATAEEQVPWAAPLAWGWPFLARLARRRRERSSIHLGARCNRTELPFSSHCLVFDWVRLAHQRRALSSICPSARRVLLPRCSSTPQGRKYL